MEQMTIDKKGEKGSILAIRHSCVIHELSTSRLCLPLVLYILSSTTPYDPSVDHNYTDADRLNTLRTVRYSVRTNSLDSDLGLTSSHYSWW